MIGTCLVHFACHIVGRCGFNFDFVASYFVVDLTQILLR